MKKNVVQETMPLQQAKIMEQNQIAEGVFLLSVEKKFDFIPGQVVYLTIGHEIPPRMYSICSGMNEKMLKILYNVQTEGLLTPKLAQLEPGDNVLISKPFGSFRPDLQNSYWIASGTGIAPYIAQVLSYKIENVHLIHGARTRQGFYFQKEFIDTPGVHYVRCCSGETLEQVFKGRLTQYIKECANLPKEAMYFLCGSTEMVVETRQILLSQGIEFSNISSEIYF